MRIGVLASGRGTNLQAILDAAAGGLLPAQVVVVISDRAEAPALGIAKARNVPAFFIDPRGLDRATFELQLADCLDRHRVDLVCLAGFMRVVGKVMLERFESRILNIHPSLLPAFPGLDAQRQAWEHGVKITGCTVHFVDRGVDTGPIILQRAVPVLDEDTPDTLAARILKAEHLAYPEAIRLFAEGRLVREGRRVRVLPPEACRERNL